MNWQYKLGIIVPSWNTVMEYEFQRMADASLSIHAKLNNTNNTSARRLKWPRKTGPAVAPHRVQPSIITFYH